MRMAMQEMIRFDIRRRRAESLMAAVLSNLYPCIDATHPEDLPHRITSLVQEAMFEVMFEHGVEVLTDADREAAGLPPRGPHGWTIEELMALERRRLEVLTRPLTMTMPAQAVRTETALKPEP